MPTGVPTPYEDRGSVPEQLMGRGDEKRNTKTFIEDGPLAMYLGFVRSMPTSIIGAGRRMYSQEFDVHFDDVSPQMILSKYPEARELIEIHQQIVEHKGSQGGFLVDAYVQKDKTANSDDPQKQSASSGESTKKRWN